MAPTALPTRTARPGRRRVPALAGAAVAVLALTVVAPGAAAPAPAAAPVSAVAPTGLRTVVDPGFTDVGPDHPFAAEIAWLVAEGVTTGYSDGSFRPTAPVSRQAMATFLVRLHDVPTPMCDASPFPDVPASSEHCGAIAMVGAGEVMTGYTDGTFRPTAPITRQAVPTILIRANGADPAMATCTTPPFVDVGLTNPFCGPIAAFTLGGIAQGYPDGTYRPAAPVSRQALAAWLHRVYADDGEGPILEPLD